MTIIRTHLARGARRSPARSLRARAGAIVVASALVLGLAACGGDSDKGSETVGDVDDIDALYAAAKKEGALTQYTNETEEVDQRVIDAFEAKYPGIEVISERLLSSDISSRFQSENAAGIKGADIVTASDKAFFDQGCDEEWFASIEDLPSVKEYWADQGDDRINGCWAVVKMTPWGILYNTDNVSEDEAPTSLEDLTDDQWAGGRLGVLDPAASGTYTWMFQTGLEDFGEDWVKDIAAQKPVYGSATELLPEVVAGAIDVMAVNSRELLLSAQAQGGSVEGVFYDGAIMTRNFNVVVTNAEHPNAARLFTNWLMSPEGQAVRAKDLLAGLPDIPGTAEDVDVSTLRPAPPEVLPNSEEGLKIRDLLGRS